MLMLRKVIMAVIATWVLLPSALLFSAGQGQLLGGSPSSPIKIEVFSDFQCPSCRDFYLETIKRVLQTYSSSNKVSVIYHETPLKMHKYSRKAAQYSEAASRMGLKNLLAVYDALFAAQAKWEVDGNIEAVLSNALSPKDFQLIKNLAKDPSIEQAIQSEELLANKQGIQSTPTMIISYRGKQEPVKGSVSFSTLKSYIESKLK
jgi:protein-disulfide isomerase